MGLSIALASLTVQAVSLTPASVPATGSQESILTLDQPATIHLSARSDSGTACELFDRVRGPFAQSGRAGRTNCELDLLLDAGQYKIRLNSSPKGTGTVQLAASPFAELNSSPVQLLDGAVHETTLKPLQQASFWVSMPTRGRPSVRVFGRHAGDVRLWRNGEWLEPITFRHATSTNTPGYPMHEWWLDEILEAGEYTLAVYGRDSVTVTDSTHDNSLTVERGFRPGPPQRAANFVLPSSGILSLAVGPIELRPQGSDVNPSKPIAVHLWLSTAPAAPVQLSVGAIASDRPLALSTSCSIAKAAVTPTCGARVNTSPSETQVAFIRGPKGTKGTIEWTTAPSDDLGTLSAWSGEYSGATSNFAFTSQVSGRQVALSVNDLPIDTDAAPQGCVLEQLEPTFRKLAHSMTRIDEGEQLEKEFNYDSRGATIWFELTDSNRYRIQTLGKRRTSCELYQLNSTGTLERLTETKAQSDSTCDHVLRLSPGQYQLSLMGGLPGIEKLLIREDSKKELKKAAVKSTCHLPPSDLSPGRYRLALTSVGNISMRSLSMVEFPIDPSKPVRLSLDPRETRSLPLRSGGVFSVVSSGGATFGCQVGGAARASSLAECVVPSGTQSLTLSNPSDVPVQLTLHRPSALPPAAAVTSYTPRLRPLPRLTPEQPAWFDFAREQTNSASFEVESPGLYNVTTLGLLRTSCRLRTPVIDLVATDSASGRGRNCLIQTYLQKGRYLLSASTLGTSKGRAALLLTRRPPKEFTGLGGEGETFFRVEANELVQQKLVIPKEGEYLLGTSAQRATLKCRLDDSQGWPVEAVPSNCTGTRTLAAGNYWWTQMPLTVESMRRTKLEKVKAPVVLKGNRPHAISAFTWYDAELGADGKDEFTFSLEGESTLDVVLTQGMQGRLYRLETEQPAKAVELIPPRETEDRIEESGEERSEEDWSHRPSEGNTESADDDEGSGEPQVAAGEAGAQMRAAPPPPSGVKVTLPSGNYRLLTEHSKGDVGLTYKLHLGSAVLLPGMSRTLPVPSTIPITIPRDGTLRLRTEGEADVRCRLFDEHQHLVVEGSENGADWNCALAEPVSKGRYTLALESETQLAGSTRVSLSLPLVEERGVFTDGTKFSLGSSVVQLTIPPGEAVQELSVKASRKSPFSCAVVGSNGVAARRSRVVDCSMLVLPKAEPWTIRLWTTDGASTVTVQSRTRNITGVASRIEPSQAVATNISRAGRFHTAAGVFCLRHASTGVFEPCGPEVSLEAGPVVFAGFGETALEVPLAEVKVAASPTPLQLSLNKEVHVQAVTAATPSLFLLSATTGWGEAAAPACSFDGPGSVRERHEASCFAVSKLGTEATARVWTASRSIVPTTVVRQAVSLPATPVALKPGRRRVKFSKVDSFALPTSPVRVEATLPKDTWALLIDRAGNTLDLCAPTNDLRSCTVSTRGGTLVLVGTGEADLTTVLLEAAPPTIAFTGLYEDSPRRPGTVRLTVPPTSAERAVLVEGALHCTLLLASGERLTSCETTLPADTSAELIIDYDVAPVRALVHTPGREKWARLGIDLPSTEGPALSPAVAVPLLQSRFDRTLVVTEPSLVRVTGETGVCGLFRGNDLLAVDGTDAGCELTRLVNPGTYRLLVRPFGKLPQAGAVQWLAEPVSELAEGIGAETWLGAGEARLFTFETKNRGRVGLGLQARNESFECAVFSDSNQLLGEGCHQYLTLEQGRFLLTVRNPNRPGAVPMAVRPVLLGLTGDLKAVPEDYLKNLFGRAGVSP